MSQPFEITLKTKLPRRLLGRLSAYMQNTKSKAALIMIEEVVVAVSISRAICSVLTGHMQSEIRIEEYDPENLYIRAGCYAKTEKGVHYPIFVEFGTSKMRARPFWRPPIWEAFYRIMERMEQLEKEFS